MPNIFRLYNFLKGSGFSPEKINRELNQILAVMNGQQEGLTGFFECGLTGTLDVVTGISTLVPWDDIVTDKESWFSNYKYTPQVKGIYHLCAGIRWLSPTVGKSYIVYLMKNGTLKRTNWIHAESGAGEVEIMLSTPVEANGTTDYFQIRVYHNTGSNVTVREFLETTFFTGYRVACS